MERCEGGREETHGQGERQELREEQDNKGGQHDGVCGFGCLGNCWDLKLLMLGFK